MKQYLVFVLPLLIYCGVAFEASAGVKKSTLVFKLKKSYQGLPYCAKTGNKWVATSNYSKGKVTLPSKKNIKADANCRKKSFGMLGASISYIREKAQSSNRQKSPHQKAAVREVTFIDPVTMEPYVVYFLNDIEISTIIGLPNHYSFVLPAEVPAHVAGQTCRVVLLSPIGALSCVPETLVGYVLEGLEANEIKAGRSFQQDAAGNTYFWALEYISGSGLPQLIKMSPSGEFSAIYRTTIDEYAPQFRVKSDGSIIFVSLSGLNVPSLKYLDSTGHKTTLIEDTRTIAGISIGFLLPFTGDEYLVGLTNYATGVRKDSSNASIIKINSSVSSFENFVSPAARSPTLATVESICSESGAELTSFCDYSGTRIASSHSTSDAAYIISAQSPLEGEALRTLWRIDGSGVEKVSLSLIVEPREMSGSGKDIIIAGKTSSGGGRIIHLDGNTREETLILDGVSVSEQLFYSIRTRAVLGGGTMDSDGRDMLITIPLSEAGPGTGATTRAPSNFDGIYFAY